MRGHFLGIRLLSQLAIAGLALTGLVGCGNTGPAFSTSTDQTKIIGGEEATGQETFAKTIVSLYDVSQGSLCTASILSDSILITAAHCVMSEPEDLRVVFGVDLEADDVIVRPVVSFRVSPIWNSRQYERFNTGDIALVKFVGGLAPGFSAATLLADPKALANGQATMLAGYGISNGAAQTGSGRLRYVETTIKNTKFSSTEVLVDQSQGKGACHGDSGGPAYVKVGGKLVVWGLTSRGNDDPNNDCSVSAVYTSVPYYASWIARTVKLMSASGTSPQIKRGPQSPPQTAIAKH